MSKLATRKVAGLVAHPLSYEIFGELTDNELDDLKDDLEKRGLQHLVEVDTQDRVICGSQRLRAIQALGWKTIKVKVRNDLIDENDVREHLIKDNVIRRQLNPHQVYMAALELERIYSEQANLNQIQCRTLGSNDQKVRSRDLAARDLGVSSTKIMRMKKIFESGNEEVKLAVDSGEMSVAAGYETVRGSTMRSQRPTGAKAESLRFQRFSGEVDRLISFLERHRPAELTRYDEEAKDKLKEVTRVVRKWK